MSREKREIAEKILNNAAISESADTIFKNFSALSKKRNSHRFLMIFIITFSILFLDQLSKSLATKNLLLNQSVPLIKGIFHLTLIHNRGAAFGVLKNQTQLFIFTSLFAIILIFWGLRKNKYKKYSLYEVSEKCLKLGQRPLITQIFKKITQMSSSRFNLCNLLFNRCNHKERFFQSSLYNISLSFILAGALGNLIDRLTLGYVIDFLDLRIWPVFNIADSAITIGAILLTWSMLRSTENRAQRTE